MKKIFKIIFTIFLGLSSLLILVWLVATLFTANSQWARAIAWLDSDYGDIERFPNREVANSGQVFQFQELPAEEEPTIRGVFETVTYEQDGKLVTKDIKSFMEDSDTVAFLVVKDDQLLYEGYFNGFDRESTVTSFSVAKSFVSALVGIAIEEGYIGSVEDPVTQYIPELLEMDPRYQDITIRHLLSMSSGIHYKEFMLPWSDDAATYYAPDLRKVAVSSPIDGEPGQQFLYNNYHPLLLGLVLERTTGIPVAKYLEEKIWQPLGMEAAGSWSLDSEKSGFEKMESGINGRAIDFAKFGRLFLNRGNWEGEQLIPSDWVEESTRLDTTTDPASFYQYFWWVNDDAEEPQFYAAGKHGQYIYIIPDQNLVFVRFGRTDRFRQWPVLFESMAEGIAEITP